MLHVTIGFHKTTNICLFQYSYCNTTLSAAARLDNHLGEGLEDHCSVIVHVEEGQTVHTPDNIIIIISINIIIIILSPRHTARLRQLQPELPLDDAEHRGVVGGLLTLEWGHFKPGYVR